MTILEGTTSTGQTIPVQVDTQGRLVAQLATSYTSLPMKLAEGNEVVFTGIPSWATKVSALFYGVAITKNDRLGIQIGNAGNWYGRCDARVASWTPDGSNYLEFKGESVEIPGNHPSIERQGIITFDNIGDDIWLISGTSSNRNLGPIYAAFGGHYTLDGGIERVRFFVTDPAESFVYGDLRVTYQ
jgi:hypothetical protein